MKRYSPILFIWLICLVASTSNVYMTYITGDLSETLAWSSASAFLANLIVYHFWATRKEEDSELIDE